jgi:membrane metallo-endopeptidase-like protein 1
MLILVMLTISNQIVLTFFIVSFSLKLATSNEDHKKSQSVKVCDNPDNIVEANRITEWLDFDINPCENFLKFACGSFFNTAVHNDRYRKISKMTMIEEKILEQRRRVLSSNVEKNDIEPFKLVKKFFWICTYTSR